MSNELSMAEREAIAALLRQGWSKRRIARELGLHRDTVRRYAREVSPAAEQRESPEPREKATAKQAAACEVATGSDSRPAIPSEVATGSDSKQAIPSEVATGKSGDVPITGQAEPPGVPAGGAVASRSSCEPYRTVIEEKIGQKLSAQRIYQDLVADHGYVGAYNAVKRMVRRLTAAQPLPFRRLECDPGEQAQADFGKGAPLLGLDGKRRRSHVFRAVLSYSRKGYSEASFKQDTESWLAGWENAFWHWGGVPRTLQTDNPKATVKQPDWYDPELHPIMTSFCKHYGTVLLPIRVRTPRHNGKAESNIGFVKENGLKARTFPTLAAENEHLAHWEANVADLRIHGTTKQQVRRLFEIERKALLPLPAARFQFFHEDRRSVHRDGHVEVAKAYYSAPPEYVGHTVWVRWDSHLVRILNAQFVEIRLHARKEPGRFQTAAEDISSKKIALVERGATNLLGRVRRIGPQAARWAEAVLKDRQIAGVRTLVGLLALARRRSSLAVEHACEMALRLNALHLRDLRALLKEPVEQTEFEFMSEHPIIRKLDDYGTLVKVHFTTDWQEPQLVPASLAGATAVPAAGGQGSAEHAN